MGRGNALAEAMEIVNSDVVVELSSDGNEDPNTIIHLLSEIERGADLVIASRFIAGGATDDSDDPVKTRRLGNKILTFLANAFWGTRLTDSTNGLRAFTREAWKMMRIYAPHFEAEFLISIRAGKLKLKIAEVSTKEGSRLGGKVKARTLRAGWQLLLVVVRELLIGNRFMA
jgi:dolichol-phosphate mannosyltransferase